MFTAAKCDRCLCYPLQGQNLGCVSDTSCRFTRIIDREPYWIRTHSTLDKASFIVSIFSGDRAIEDCLVGSFSVSSPASSRARNDLEQHQKGPRFDYSRGGCSRAFSGRVAPKSAHSLFLGNVGARWHRRTEGYRRAMSRD